MAMQSLQDLLLLVRTQYLDFAKTQGNLRYL
jgi:hypothetical protein